MGLLIANLDSILLHLSIELSYGHINSAFDYIRNLSTDTYTNKIISRFVLVADGNTKFILLRKKKFIFIEYCKLEKIEIAILGHCLGLKRSDQVKICAIKKRITN